MKIIKAISAWLLVLVVGGCTAWNIVYPPTFGPATTVVASQTPIYVFQVVTATPAFAAAPETVSTSVPDVANVQSAVGLTRTAFTIGEPLSTTPAIELNAIKYAVVYTATPVTLAAGEQFLPKWPDHSQLMPSESWPRCPVLNMALVYCTHAVDPMGPDDYLFIVSENLTSDGGSHVGASVAWVQNSTAYEQYITSANSEILPIHTSFPEQFAAQLALYKSTATQRPFAVLGLISLVAPASK
jgi:hypothetical protein